jgi:glycosyltransferase involved in cell wall biosynthesis
MFFPLAWTINSTSVELSVLLAAVSLIIACWLYLIARALHSHANTPVIIEGANDARYADNGKFNFHLPFVSIIVPARNEQNNIEKCLLSLLTQNYPNYEVIAVDDNSTDRTLDVLRKLESEPGFKGKLKVVTATGKPADWTGKTWASQQGYLSSRGKLLLFTDADSCFESRNVISLTVNKVLSENLDVLTGVPYLPLKDFWSKTVMPVWNLYSEVFDHGIADVNNTNSKVAFVMGSFFLIKRSVFKEIGAYDSVRHEIQEDRAIGLLLKGKQYKMKMFKIDSLVTALWSRDLYTLWHGIRRTVTPLAIRQKSTVISHQMAFFVMVVLPFLLLPYLMMLSNNYAISQLASLINLPFTDTSSPSVTYQHLHNSVDRLRTLNLNSALFVLDSLLCLLIVIVTSVKGAVKYRLVPVYSILCFVGASFLIVSYAYSTIPFLTGGNGKPIPWKGRPHDPVLRHNNNNNKRKST